MVLDPPQQYILYVFNWTLKVMAKLILELRCTMGRD
jgi:hypothetical protein